MSATPTITVHLDDRRVELPADATLAALLARESLADSGASTALNGRFVPRGARASTPLADGDQVLLFHPIVGG